MPLPLLFRGSAAAGISRLHRGFPVLIAVREAPRPQAGP